jgi:hypothetical protein
MHSNVIYDIYARGVTYAPGLGCRPDEAQLPAGIAGHRQRNPGSDRKCGGALHLDFGSPRQRDSPLIRATSCHLCCARPSSYCNVIYDIYGNLWHVAPAMSAARHCEQAPRMR